MSSRRALHISHPSLSFKEEGRQKEPADRFLAAGRRTNARHPVLTRRGLPSQVSERPRDWKPWGVWKAGEGGMQAKGKNSKTSQ